LIFRNKGGGILDVALIVAILPLGIVLVFMGAVVYLVRGKRPLELEFSALGVSVKLKSGPDGQSVGASSIPSKE